MIDDYRKDVFFFINSFPTGVSRRTDLPRDGPSGLYPSLHFDYYGSTVRVLLPV